MCLQQLNWQTLLACPGDSLLSSAVSQSVNVSHLSCLWCAQGCRMACTGITAAGLHLENHFIAVQYWPQKFQKTTPRTCYVTVSLLEGQPSLLHTHHRGKHNLTIPLYYRWCVYHTRSKLVLGAVFVGPHTQIDLEAPGFFPYLLGYVWGDSLTC